MSELERLSKKQLISSILELQATRATALSCLHETVQKKREYAANYDALCTATQLWIKFFQLLKNRELDNYKPESTANEWRSFAETYPIVANTIARILLDEINHSLVTKADPYQDLLSGEQWAELFSKVLVIYASDHSESFLTDFYNGSLLSTVSSSNNDLKFSVITDKSNVIYSNETACGSTNDSPCPSRDKSLENRNSYDSFLDPNFRCLLASVINGELTPVKANMQRNYITEDSKLGNYIDGLTTSTKFILDNSSQTLTIVSDNAQNLAQQRESLGDVKNTLQPILSGIKSIDDICTKNSQTTISLKSSIDSTSELLDSFITSNALDFNKTNLAISELYNEVSVTNKLVTSQKQENRDTISGVSGELTELKSKLAKCTDKLVSCNNMLTNLNAISESRHIAALSVLSKGLTHKDMDDLIDHVLKSAKLVVNQTSFDVSDNDKILSAFKAINSEINQKLESYTELVYNTITGDFGCSLEASFTDYLESVNQRFTSFILTKVADFKIKSDDILTQKLIESSQKLQLEYEKLVEATNLEKIENCLDKNRDLITSSVSKQLEKIENKLLQNNNSVVDKMQEIIDSNIKTAVKLSDYEPTMRSIKESIDSIVDISTSINGTLVENSSVIKQDIVDFIDKSTISLKEDLSTIPTKLNEQLTSITKETASKLDSTHSAIISDVDNKISALEHSFGSSVKDLSQLVCSSIVANNQTLIDQLKVSVDSLNTKQSTIFGEDDLLLLSHIFMLKESVCNATSAEKLTNLESKLIETKDHLLNLSSSHKIVFESVLQLVQNYLDNTKELLKVTDDHASAIKQRDDEIHRIKAIIKDRDAQLTNIQRNALNIQAYLSNRSSLPWKPCFGDVLIVSILTCALMMPFLIAVYFQSFSCISASFM